MTLTKKLAAEKLGRPIQDWDFKGQCYIVPTNAPGTCALTGVPAKIAFTLKPIDGAPGRVYVSENCLPFVEKAAPALYTKLVIGCNFLSLNAAEYARDVRNQQFVKRLHEAQDTHKSLIAQVKEAIRAIKKAKRTENLELLKNFIAVNPPKTREYEILATWYEGQNASIQTALRVTTQKPEPFMPNIKTLVVEEIF